MTTFVRSGRRSFVAGLSAAAVLASRAVSWATRIGTATLSLRIERLTGSGRGLNYLHRRPVARAEAPR